MVEEKIEETREKVEDKINETKDRFDEKKEKGKTVADNVVNDLNKTIEELKENLRNIQKAADDKYNSYKNSTVQNLDADLIESNNTYYLKIAVPGLEKEEINIEASDNDITIEAEFTAYIDEFDEDEEAKVIAKGLKTGKCVKTVRFENNIDVENISAKFNNGIIIITIPKLVIPKHKVTVE